MLTPLPGPPLQLLGLEPWPDASQGAGRVITVEDWAEIRRLHRAEKMPIKAIVRHLGISRNTVREALRGRGAASL